MRKQMFGGGLPRLALSLLATLMMVSGLCPLTGFAEEIVGVEPDGEAIIEAQGEGPALEAQVVKHTHDDQVFDEWTDELAGQQYGDGDKTAKNSLPIARGNYYLTDDVTLSEPWDVDPDPDQTIKLCLNGHTITSADKSASIYVYGTLELYDKEGGGTIDGGNVLDYSCVTVYGDAAVFSMHGGTITGGGGASSFYGGGVCLLSNGATFNMSGGTITGNTAMYGGGVRLWNGAIFNMSGGTITGNTAERGGGVYVAGGYKFQSDEQRSATMTVSGGAAVSGNTNKEETASNVFVGQGIELGEANPALNAKIAVAGALSDGASFGVTMPEPGTFTVGFKDNMGGADPATYFTSDDEYAVTADAGGEGMLAQAYPVTVDEGIQNGTVEVDKAKAAAGASVKVMARAADGYELDTVTVTDADGKQVETKDGSFAMPAKPVTVSAKFVKKAEPKPADGVALTGSGHVQTYGDVAAKASGKGIVIGTTDEAKRLEQFTVSLPKDTNGSIEYRAHLQGKGWGEWSKDGAPCGTTHESRRIEAVQLSLTGALAETHSVWYRVHSQTFGWLGWAKDGQAAGTAGQAKRAEAVEVQVLPQGQVPEGYEEKQASYVGAVSADVHLQKVGWTGASSAIEFGTTGQSRRLEAVRLSAPATPVAGGISYEAHVQKKGWMPAADGALAGTTGQAKRLEAVRISLTGDAAKDGNYSVWYRVHSQTYGWLGWTCDGEPAGTTGLAKRAEAIDVQVLPQGQVPRGYDASKPACVTK